MGKTLIICEKASQVVLFSNSKYANKTLKKIPNAQEAGDYIYMAVTGHAMTLSHLLSNTQWEENREIKFLNKDDLASNFDYSEDRKKLGQEIVKYMRDDRVTEIVSCVDTDVDGEVLFANLLQKANVPNKKVTRVWFAEQTEEGAIKGMDNRQDINTPLFKNLKNRGYFRIVSDFETGTNLSVSAIMASKRNNGDTNLSLGRVQSVILGIINDRYVLNKSFKSITTCRPKVVLKGKEFIFNNLDFKTQESLQKYIDTNMKDVEFTLSSTLKNGYENYPGGYTQSSFGVWGNNYKESGKKVFKSIEEITSRQDGVLQNLYSNGYISYPGTSEDAIGVAEAIDLANNHGNKTYYGVKIGSEYLFKKNMKKSPTGGHGHLHPTSKIPSKSELNHKERIVYDEIARNTFAHFLPKPKTVTVSFTLSFKDEDGNVQTSSPLSFKALKDEGYLAIYPIKNYKYSLEQVLNLEMKEPKTFNNGSNVTIHNVTTKPPAIFTEETLESVMDDIASMYDDKETKKIFRTKNELGESVNIGIGANNTKPAHIQKLISKGFIKKDGKKYIPTEKGTSMIEQLRAAGLTIQELENFAKLEKTMQELQNEGKDPSAIYKELEKEILSDIEKLKASKFKVARGNNGSAKSSNGDKKEVPVFETKKKDGFVYKNHYSKKKVKVNNVELSITKARMKTMVDKGIVTIDGQKYKLKTQKSNSDLIFTQLEPVVSI